MDSFSNSSIENKHCDTLMCLAKAILGFWAIAKAIPVLWVIQTLCSGAPVCYCWAPSCHMSLRLELSLVGHSHNFCTILTLSLSL